ncbi:MAG: hypothetical protein O3A47_03635 [Chloroflexi bacterium]|nr:hypothetical protein [Chloroflexota bacterium]
MMLSVAAASAAQGVITEVNPSGVSNGIAAVGSPGASTAAVSPGITGLIDTTTDVGLLGTPARGLLSGLSQQTGTGTAQ